MICIITPSLLKYRATYVKIRDYMQKPNMTPILMERQGRATGHVYIWTERPVGVQGGDGGEEMVLEVFEISDAKSA